MTEKKSHRTSGTNDRCEYSTGFGKCKEKAAGELRVKTPDGIPWALCEQHLKPEHHAFTGRGRLVKWDG